MKLLMCPPLYYGIEYENNPLTSDSRKDDPDIAKRQWRALYHSLTN